MSEEIEIKLTGSNDAFFADLDRRFDDLSKRFGQQLGRQVASGGGGAGGGFGGGGGGGPAGGVAQLGAQAIQAVGAGAASGISSTPFGALRSPGVVAQNAAVGAAGGLVHAASGAIQAGGMLLGGAVGGPLGAAAGGALGQVAGTLIEKQFGSFEEAFKAPTDRAQHRLEARIGDLAAHGINVSDEAIEAMSRRTIGVERKRFQAERRVQRIVQETGQEMGSVGWGLSQAGF